MVMTRRDVEFPIGEGLVVTAVVIPFTFLLLPLAISFGYGWLGVSFIFGIIFTKYQNGYLLSKYFPVLKIGAYGLGISALIFLIFSIIFKGKIEFLAVKYPFLFLAFVYLLPLLAGIYIYYNFDNGEVGDLL